MDPAFLVTVGAAAAVLLAVLCVLLAVALRGRRRLQRDLDGTRAELAALGAQLERLADAQRQQPAPEEAVPARPAAEYVITTVGDREPDEVAPRPPVEPLTAGQFASVALGESLVRILSFGYGVRRALSAENRNRIAFEMRREVKRSRKQRRQELKQARRHLRTAQRADLDEDAA